MSEWMRRTAVAFAFMTRLPVPTVQPRDGDLRHASVLFPLVGLAVATLGVGARALVEPFWGPAAGTVAGVLTVVAATGALHEDGLADSADGLWGGWEPEQRLAIMRDSRLGTYGTIALVAVFALRFALLVPVPFGTFAAALVSGHVLGRASALLMVRLATAVPGSSAADMAEPAGAGPVAVAAVLTIGPVAVAAGVAAALLLLVTAVVTLGAARLFNRRLGGVTGDALGATIVVVELAAIATMTAWQGISG